MASTRKNAPIPLYPYQRRWIEDKSRFKGAVKSVQLGWTWAMALEVALDMAGNRGSTWLWMSGSQRQSREAAEYCKTHLRAMGAAGAVLDHDVEEFFGKTKTLVDRITMPNGARAFFLPANPDTARGFAGNVVLDEFAIHENAKAIWAAMFGRVSRGFKLRVFSSAKGAIGKFWELVKQAGLDTGVAPAVQPVKAGAWSWHWCDLNMGIADGAPLDYEELRSAMGDDDLFAQEYLCAFLDAESQLIPTDRVEAAVSPRATLALPADFRPLGVLYMGTDVARKRDFTAHAIGEKLGDSFIVRAIDLQHRATFAAQKARMKEFLPLVRRHAIDASGLGMQNAEELQREFPEKCEPVNFAPDIKAVMALGLKKLFEDRQLEIPDDRDLKADIKAVKRIITEAGNIRYDARRTENGHADRFWALGLMWHASDQRHEPMSDGVCVGRGLITAAGPDGILPGFIGSRHGDWHYPDHSDDRRPGHARFGGRRL